MIRYFICIFAALAAFSTAAEDKQYTAPSLSKESRLFEMRTYYVAPGKLEALQNRFHNFTNKLFTKHGMQMIGYWVPMDKEGHYENKLIYILAFPNKEEHDKDWKEFSTDLEWQAVKLDSEKNGKLVEKVESVFMTATDYSPIK